MMESCTVRTLTFTVVCNGEHHQRAVSEVTSCWKMCDELVNILLSMKFVLSFSFGCSGMSTAISVAQQMTEMSLSSEELGASGAKVELTDVGRCESQTRVAFISSYSK